MNQRPEVSYQSMLGTFKDWNYLPWKIKLEMATAIINELNLTNIKHPYIQKVKYAQKTKILKFPEIN